VRKRQQSRRTVSGMRLGWLVILLLALASLTACGNDSAPPSIALKITAVNPYVGRAIFHLHCTPPRGDLVDNGRACAALAAEPTLVSSPKPFVCLGGTTSWWDITISGRIDGRRLHRSVSTCWTPQMTMIGRLGLARARSLESHLLPRRIGRVLPGVPRTFAPGRLRAGDVVTCNIRRHYLSVGIPPRSDVPLFTGYSGAHVVTVTLEIVRNPDGTLLASCHDGAP
jgi:hypothetical protein